MAAGVKLVTVEFEVFGRVQGVFFRKYTQQTASSLGLVGWVKNTAHDTVVGVVQGPEGDVKKMEDWLRNTGSPSSVITKLDLKNRSSVSQVSFPSFGIKGGWQQWLQTTGSPKSKITGCQFKNEKEVSEKQFPSFDIDRGGTEKKAKKKPKRMPMK